MIPQRGEGIEVGAANKNGRREHLPRVGVSAMRSHFGPLGKYAGCRALRLLGDGRVWSKRSAENSSWSFSTFVD